MKAKTTPAPATSNNGEKTDKIDRRIDFGRSDSGRTQSTDVKDARAALFTTSAAQNDRLKRIIYSQKTDPKTRLPIIQNFLIENILFIQVPDESYILIKRKK